MEFILENLWQHLPVAVSCLFCEYPQQDLTEEKAQLKQLAMDIPPSLFFQKKLGSPAFPSPTLAAHLHQDWLLVRTLSKGLHLLILLLSWPFFVF